MTASIISSRRQVSAALGDRFLPGVGALVRKDLGEWIHGSRAVIVLTITALFMALAAANSWIQAWVVANVPEAAQAAAGGAGPKIFVLPWDNLASGVASQIFLFAAVFAAMSLIVRERESGTLAWVASKPVSRSSIWIAKWISASAALFVAAVVLPMAITVAVVGVLYGLPSMAAVAVTTLGMGAAIVFLVAVALGASTFVANQGAVAGISFAVMFVPGIIAGILPFDLAPFLPTSILAWSMGLVGGANVGVVTPIAWALGLTAVVAFSVRRMDGLEL
jgi:ABC-type transport system involved in multi-copper enzyme maturation permease subunit